MVGIELFLSPTERENVVEWTYSVEDKSISTKLLSPFWNTVVKFVPERVAPNVLSLAGLLCITHAFYLCYMYNDSYPRLVSIGAVFLIFAYQTLDAIDGKHARITGNSSPLGELFDHGCDNVGVVFLMLAICIILGVEDPTTQWYIVQCSQFVFLVSHLDAFKTRLVSFAVWTGPGEALIFFMLLLVVRAVAGLHWVWTLYEFIFVGYLTPLCARLGYTLDSSNPIVILQETFRLAYYLLWARVLVNALMLPKNHQQTRNGLVLCLVYRVIPVILSFYSIMPREVTLLQTVADGLFLSIITSDLILAKMAKRELHPWVIIFTMISVFNNFVILFLCAVYYVAIFSEICGHMNIPMFTINRNVYVDGIYDMCHFGHKMQFKNALAFGNRLLVGVVNDADATPYKRKPIMTHEERCNEVKLCKNVHVVIPNAPCNGLTEEFIKKHRIHIVAHSEEYNRPDDKYYAVPRAMGITRVLPRTDGISTSELIKRIQAMPPPAKK